MRGGLIIVDGYLPTALDNTNLRADPWSIALDQRAFGPGRLLVAFADADGRFRGLAFTARTDPIEPAFAACLDFLGNGAAAAIAYCDEPVTEGPPSIELLDRLSRTQAIAAELGICLVDWISCDDQLFRSSRLSMKSPADTWPLRPD